MEEKRKIAFHCQTRFGKKTEKWDGYIRNYKDYGLHQEMEIQSRSGFEIIIGKSRYGKFICIPAYGVGSALSSLDDEFWNVERLSGLMNKVDAVTVGSALKALMQTRDKEER